jgi:hypothetical protein
MDYRIIANDSCPFPTISRDDLGQSPGVLVQKGKIQPNPGSLAIPPAMLWLITYQFLGSTNWGLLESPGLYHQ